MDIKKKVVIGILLVAVISMIGLVGIGYAYKGDPQTKGPNYSPKVHQQLQAAIEAKDYDTWIKIRKENNLPMNGKMFQVITKENFGKYAELHKANLEGNTAKADAIKQELGLG
ncbi:MAG: hypothetical protein QW594_04300 [Candidatus Woesearchaeota archaeon]